MKTAMTVTFELATWMKPEDVDWEAVVDGVSRAIDTGVVLPGIGGMCDGTTHVTRKGEHEVKR